MNNLRPTQRFAVHTVLWLAICFSFQCMANPDNSQTNQTVSFSQDILPLFMDRCAICHQAEDRHGYLVVDTDNTLAGMVNVPSYSVPALMRVKPGEPEQSYLWLKLTGKHYEVGGNGWRMPYMSRLSEPQLQAVYDWIDQGAKDN